MTQGIADSEKLKQWLVSSDRDRPEDLFEDENIVKIAHEIENSGLLGYTEELEKIIIEVNNFFKDCFKEREPHFNQFVSWDGHYLTLEDVKRRGFLESQLKIIHHKLLIWEVHAEARFSNKLDTKQSYWNTSDLKKNLDRVRLSEGLGKSEKTSESIT